MQNKYAKRVALFFLLAVILITASCKKSSPDTVEPAKNLATLGLYEYGNGTGKRLILAISQIGSKTVSYGSIFDTGSSGLTIDADGILPATMITANGLQITGDSVVVNGITVTNKTGIISYGDLTGTTKEYGNLAYAPITIGDENGKITTKRIPFFIYYKVVDGAGKQYGTHSFDIFGVGPGLSYGNSNIGSPLSYFDMPAGVTNGFKITALNPNGFISVPTYIPGLLTLGLSSDDLASSSGYIYHPLSYFTFGGYSANIPATITYGSTSVAAQILFDTGTPSVTTIEDKTATAIGALPVNTLVTITTNKGFKYQYTTSATGNLTQIQNPNNTGDTRSIFSLDFFIKNNFITDYTHHQIGLKNN